VHPVGRYEDRDLQAPGPVSAQLIQVVDDMMNFRDTRFGHYFQPLT